MFGAGPSVVAECGEVGVPFGTGQVASGKAAGCGNEAGRVVPAPDPSFSHACHYRSGPVEPPAGDDRGVVAEVDQLPFVAKARKLAPLKTRHICVSYVR